MRGASSDPAPTLFELFNLGSPEVTEWRLDALCAETDPELFHPEKGGPTSLAKQVCRSCSVRQQCLNYALDHHERDGIWGGLAPRERRAIVRERRSAVSAEFGEAA
jgi:WhiB family redox-sensing transcriptional regulator